MQLRVNVALAFAASQMETYIEFTDARGERSWVFKPEEAAGGMREPYVNGYRFRPTYFHPRTPEWNQEGSDRLTATLNRLLKDS